MKPVSVKEFIEQLKLAIARVLPHLTLKIVEENPHRFKGRITLTSGRNVDVFYGSKKGRIDFALIDGNQRIWGVDILKPVWFLAFQKTKSWLPLYSPARRAVWRGQNSFWIFCENYFDMGTI